ncbi:MAG: NUDIX hydrolase [Acidimicrobiia bacterium]
MSVPRVRLGGGPPTAGPDDLDAAVAAVRAVPPGDAAHEARRARILAFCGARPDALLRSCAAGHLTGSALVVDPATRRIALLLHAKLGRWLQPGGHADGDGHLARVAWCEATEETGIAGLRVATPAIDLDVHLISAPGGPDPDHLHLDVRYLVVAPPGAVLAPNHESTDHRWARPDELAGLGCDPGLRRLARVGLAALDLVEVGPDPGR